uniref:Si:ch211-255f4.7 n=1 Tax=Astyanax mexicanus TaxID=7994 RepID=A0A8B9HAU7_ASTMX
MLIADVIFNAGASFPCTNCQKLAIPQYHLAMPDGSIRNFCTYDCVGKFQERLQKPSPQVNGSSTVTANASGVAPRGPQHPSAAPRPSAPPQITNPTSNQTTIPPHVPAPGLAAPQGSQQHQQQPGAAAASSPGPARLTCKQCQKPISSKPEVLQYKNHVGLFCSRLCCDSYKREKDVKATCEYCKEEKILKDITMYEHKLRPFCCEGCKLLFKHELSKQHGAQCRVCAYCSNMTHNTIQNHFGGKLEEFCTEECMSLYTVLFYEMAKCYGCKTQGTLSESLKWDGTIKHFCNLHCVLQFCCKSIIPDQPISNERHSPPKALKILGLIGGENSEVEDLSDMDDVVGDPQYQPPKQEPISSSEEEEDSSGCEDPFPQSSQLIGGLKRHRDEYEDDRVSDCDVHNHRSQLCRRLSLTQQDEADVSNDVPEETTPPGPSRREQFEKERGLRWRTSSTLKPIQEVQFKHEEEMVQNRESWTPLDYIEQYIDKDLMKMIADCSNATSLARCEIPLNTSTDEIYHYFGACILMSCVPYPSIRMYWFKTLKFPAITEKFTRDRFFRLRRSLKVLVDDDVPDDLRERDKFWKVRPFLNRVLKGCRSQTRPKCVSIDEQMIPFTGACPSRQFLPMKPNPVGIKNFVCATEDGIVLDFDVYQGANALLEQVQQQPGDLHLDLGGLVADRLSQTLHPNTKIYCGRFFTSIQVLELMLKKQMYVTGTVKKNRVAAAVQKLPTNERLRKDGMGFSAQVTTKDGKICVVKWYDNKPVLMMSSVHAREPEDNCQRWNKKLKQYVTISRPNIVSEYKSKTRGVELADRMMSCYHMSGSTKKWTLRMLMYFTDLALANSWLLYRKDLTERGTPKKSIMQFLEFRMEVATTFLAQHANDSSGFSEQDEPDVFVEGKRRRPAKALPHVSFRRRSNAHLPEVVNKKNAVRCRVKGCSGKTRVRCVTCEVFLCLQGERNCYAAFHT